VSLVGFLVFLILYNKSSTNSKYSVLFNNLSSSDSALIIQQLNKNNVPYKITDSNTIEVPSNIVYKERIAISASGLPKDGKVGFEIFDKQSFGSTDFEQQIKYLRALEGELSRTVQGLDPIERASVRIALPKPSVFSQNNIPPTASVVVYLKPMTKLSNKQIIGIKNLIAASVPKLKAGYVKVIDSNGITLGSDENSFDSDAVKAQLQYKKIIEKSYENKIQKVLAPIVGGINNVVARVSTDFDFDKTSVSNEIYDPNSVPRSEQSEEIKKQGTIQKPVGGVPGAVSNIGPTQGLSSNGQQKEIYTKSTTTTNYEISKKILKSKGQFAVLKRLTAAVVIDGKYKNKLNKNGKVIGKEYVPLSPDELKKVKALVEQAIGPILKFLIAALLLFIFYRKVIVPFGKKMLETTYEDHEERLEKEVANEEESAEDTLDKFRTMKRKVEEQLGIEGEFNEEEVKYDVLLDKLKGLVDNKADETASIIESLFRSERDINKKMSLNKEKV